MERTHRVASLGGVVVISYDFDDASGRILRVRCVNDGPGTPWVRLAGSDSSGPAASFVFEHTFGPGTTVIDIPPRDRKRFDLEPDGRGPAGEGEPDYYPTLRGLTVEAAD